MDSVQRALVRVRGWVVAAFVVQSVIGTAIAFEVIDIMRRTPAFGGALGSHEAAGTLMWTVAALLGVLVLLLWLFDRLINRQAWARLVLLVVGWISAVSAAISVVSAPMSGVVVERFLPAAVRGDVASLAGVSLLTNLVALVSWGYLIWTLQFRDDVRAAFLPPVPPASPTHVPSR